MSQGHLDRFSNALDHKRVRTNGLSGSASPKGNVPKNTSYEKYKASLHAFFDGKAPLPDHIRALSPSSDLENVETEAQSNTFVDKAPKAEKKSIERSPRRLSSVSAPTYDVFIEAIKKSTTPDEITRTIDALVEAGHQLPGDEDILSKGLSHRNEEVVHEILCKLEQLLASQPVRSPRLLKTRIENAALLASSARVKELCRSLRETVVS